MNSKGITPQVLNWIFVLIAGGIILLFFFRVILIQTEIATREVTAEVTKGMEAVLVGRGTATGTDVEIKIPDKTFTFECEEPCNPFTGCQSFLQVEGGSAIDTRTQPIFNTRKMEANKMYAFVRPWSIPFSVTNFLYLAHPQEKIIFDCTVGDVSKCNSVYNLIPQRIKDRKIVVNAPEESNAKYVEHVKFVTGGCTDNSDGDKGICINTVTNTINFYPENIALPYFKDELILGAIFTEDAGTYSCNLKKSIYKMNNVQYVLEQKRSNVLAIQVPGLQPDSTCIANYRRIDKELPAYAVDFENFNGTSLNVNATRLEQFNRVLQRNSCPSLY